MNDAVDRNVLAACREALVRQTEMVALLAAAWRIEPRAVFYRWCRERPQPGFIPGTAWRYFFHGLECDFDNQDDGRHVRANFAPGGRADAVDVLGVLAFVMTSKPPWGSYPALQQLLATAPPPYTAYSGDYQRMAALLEPLYAAGVFVLADPALHAFQQQHTSFDARGTSYVAMPAGVAYSDPLQREFWDTLVCHRMVLAARWR